MLEGLNAIPWAKLTHAYGSAEDVPEALRAIAGTERDREKPPVLQLFGTIYHQGTVYETTAYAVPFLIVLAANPHARDRAVILQLLAAIAGGTSYCAVHGNILDSVEFEKQKDKERAWVAAAHKAVASGVETFLALTAEEGEIRLAAAHLLAQLSGYMTIVRPHLRMLLSRESRPLYRAGLLLLLGHCGDRSGIGLSMLHEALAATETVERLAAAVAIARLGPQKLSDPAREAILGALTMNDLDTAFRGLPWDVEVSQYDLLTCLDTTTRDEAANRLIVAIEKGAAPQQIDLLLEILFSRTEPEASPWRPSELSRLQHRGVEAIARIALCEGPLFLRSLRKWGLPDTKRGWVDFLADC
ncbi:MAG: hypothetical protein JO357_15260 [Hyphomicrobiales bacterium]|nr:hypothetical protein [Hyphomicrobiales bacterium]